MQQTINKLSHKYEISVRPADIFLQGTHPHTHTHTHIHVHKAAATNVGPQLFEAVL